MMRSHFLFVVLVLYVVLFFFYFLSFVYRLQETQQRNADLASNMEHGPKASASSMVVIYDVQNGDRRPASLVRSFGDLYSVSRLETLDALDAICEMIDADELKNKLLFSVVVVSVIMV